VGTRALKAYGTLALKEHTADGVKVVEWRLDANPHVHARAKRVFGKFGKQQSGVLWLSANVAETARDLEWFLQRYPVEMTEPDRAHLTALAQQHKDLLLRLEDIVGAGYTPRTFALAKPPRDYQAREAELYLARGGLLVGDDVGLGKTITGICSFTDSRTLPAVVVLPAHLPKQWTAKLREFAPDLHVHTIRSGTPYELPKVKGHGPDVLLTTYYKLDGWAKVLASHCRSVVFDEVQELRHSGSGKYNAAEYVAQHMNFRLGLSATPTYNYGGEIFNVLNPLLPGCLGTHAEFVNEWCKPGSDKDRLADPVAFGAWAREQFLMVRHTRKDVGRELPPVISVPQLIGSDRKALDRVEAQAASLAQLILNQSAAVEDRWQASEQLSSVLRQATGISKAPYVADFVRILVESGEQVLLCGWHREVYDIWNAKLRDLAPVMYTGSESPAAKEAARQRFLAKQSPLMLMSLRSGIGMDGLEQVCSCIVFGELDWSPYVHKQCVGRLDRDGQKVPVVAYYLMCEDGADPEIAEVLGLKLEQGEGIRNPQHEEQVFQNAERDGSRARQLAQAYLEKLRRRGGLPAQDSAPNASLFA
jgi:SNF2 family DNA or RNA helicase